MPEIANSPASLFHAFVQFLIHHIFAIWYIILREDYGEQVTKTLLLSFSGAGKGLGDRRAEGRGRGEPPHLNPRLTKPRDVGITLLFLGGVHLGFPDFYKRRLSELELTVK